MKKYLFIALAAFGLVACTDNWNDPNSPNFKGELEESYIAINLMSADLESRAEDTYGSDFGLEYGTVAERAIQTAYFFFFDENGNPFNVLGTPATAPGGVKNHLSLDITTITSKEGTPVENVSDISNAVLVLNTYKGIYPKQIVAVLNWTPDANQAYSLTQLHEHLATLGNDTNGYVMSNSVYSNEEGTKMVDAVAITENNIKKNADDAKNAPIEIYVERIAAKVVLTASKKIEGTDNIFDTQKDSTPIVTLGETSTIDVYVKLLGWELFNDYNNSTLLKNITPNWSAATLGLTWNDLPKFRCYWASSQSTNPNDKFSWSYVGNDATTTYGLDVGSHTYCGENTNQLNNDTDYRTKVILKGQLMKKNGENYEPLELASWYGNEYAGNEALRTAVANSLKYILYSSTNGETFTSIKPEDLECVAGVPGIEAYEVGFQLSTAGANKIWYQYSSAGGYHVLGALDTTSNNSATNAYLTTNVEPALLYTSGQTYYIVDIKHLGATDKTAEYGVVRNHVYQIDINSIKGYGSPVFSGTSNILTPEYPEKVEDSYVAARINVLSWKVVKQGVDIVQ